MSYGTPNKTFSLESFFIKKRESFEGIYSELLLYLPWQNESDLKENNEEECIELFNQNRKLIEQNKGTVR